jgi:serine/threonine-protein kinase
MSVATDPRIGSVLAGYRIEELLGRGGMGVVYLAQDLSLQRRVALKLLAPELSAEEAFRERFLRESRIAASIDHPNVIPIYEAGEFEGMLFIAMRYVDGTDLRRLLEQEDGRLEPARAIGLLAQVAEALDVAHEHGLVHRDVKPANILIARQGGREHVYLADFGLSRQLTAPGALERSHFSGSADYAAPEQIRREPVDGRADLYALACVLHECLTGRPPFHRDALTATLFAHLEDDPPRVSKVNPGLPAEIDPVLAQALAKEAAGRQATCRELTDGARQALGISERPSWRHLPRRFKLAALLVALGIAAAAAVPALLLTGGAPEEPPLQITDTSLVRFDRDTGEPTAVVDLKSPVTAVVRLEAGNGAVWLTDPGRGTVLRIDEDSSAVASTTALPDPAGIAVSPDAVWVAGAEQGHGILAELDPTTGFIRGPLITLPPLEPTGVAIGESAVWVAAKDPLGGTRSEVWRVDPVTRAVTTVATITGQLIDIGVSAGAVWALAVTLRPNSAQLTRIDPGLGTSLAPLDLGPSGNGWAMAVDDDGVWVSVEEGLVRVDAATGQASPPAPAPPYGFEDLAAESGELWAVGLTGSSDGGLWRLDPATGNVVTKLGPAGWFFYEVTVGESGVWAYPAQRDDLG